MFIKGQEEAPFQLLVAVILMTFVIIVGVNAMLKAEQQKCFNDTEKIMNDFKLAIEKTATYKQPSNVKFFPPGCTKDETFEIKRTDEGRICRNLCVNSSSSCLLLRYSTSEVTGVQDKCINVSYDTQFRSTEDSQDCSELSGFTGTKVDSDLGLEKGVYQFIPFSSPEINYPVVCSYVKE